MDSLSKLKLAGMVMQTCSSRIGWGSLATQQVYSLPGYLRLLSQVNHYDRDLLPLASWDRAVRATSLSPQTPLWEQQWECHVVVGQRSLETHTWSGSLGFRRREQPHLEQAFPGALMLFLLPCPFCCLEPATCAVPQLFPMCFLLSRTLPPLKPIHPSGRKLHSVLTLLERLFLLPKELACTTAN